METGIIIAAFVIVGLGMTFTIGALWAVRATLDRDRTLVHGATTALQEEIGRVASNHAALIGGLRSTAQGLTVTVEVLRRDLSAAQEDARAARLAAHKLAPCAELTPAGRAAPPPLAQAPRMVRPADAEGDETAFIERPVPANDRAGTVSAPITPTKLSPAPVSRDPKA